jgi:hypothetical protein
MCVEKFYTACEKCMNESFQLLEVLETAGVGGEQRSTRIREARKS